MSKRHKHMENCPIIACIERIVNRIEQFKCLNAVLLQTNFWTAFDVRSNQVFWAIHGPKRVELEFFE